MDDIVLVAARETIEAIEMDLIKNTIPLLYLEVTVWARRDWATIPQSNMWLLVITALTVITPS